ncbi:Germin-like protein 8-2 [Capsicum baccatum]|uniref:Germin-like protein n=1 Tax=Capsicum baccatum TaxID=33114 RepID=A0A2G2VWE0_CAPBA|nr:Germin-like protein 8-2 [Capsicum baccatum]
MSLTLRSSHATDIKVLFPKANTESGVIHPASCFTTTLCTIFYPELGVYRKQPLYFFGAMLNGFICKNPMLAEANDFHYSGLDEPKNRTTQSGVIVTPVSVAQVPGLNTLGISMARVDYAPGAVNPPHFHPRASEMLVLIEGSLHVGFVTSNPENRLIQRVIQTGDVFVFPLGLMHFQRNVGNGNAVALLALNSQSPGITTIRDAEQNLPEELIPRHYT